VAADGGSGLAEEADGGSGSASGLAEEADGGSGSASGLAEEADGCQQQYQSGGVEGDEALDGGL
jgi:hypothetical protein